MASHKTDNLLSPGPSGGQRFSVREDETGVVRIMDELLVYVAEEFEKLIAVKTGWGKNEIMPVFYKAWVLGLSRYARKKGVDLT